MRETQTVFTNLEKIAQKKTKNKQKPPLSHHNMYNIAVFVEMHHSVEKKKITLSVSIQRCNTSQQQQKANSK